MRLELTLKPLHKNYIVPFNYNYQISSAIYRIFQNSSPEFSYWLHAKGWIGSDNKPIKMFNFSKLFFQEVNADNDILIAKGYCKFFLTSPIEEKIIQHFILGIMHSNDLIITSKKSEAKFRIISADIIPNPNFSDNMKFIMLSPTTSSITIEKEGKKSIQYLLPDSKEIKKALIKNLQKKYELIYQQKYNGNIELDFDWDYINKRGGVEKITKLITVKEDTKNEIKIRGFICPIIVNATSEINKIAYELGIGEKNSLGFGMLDVY